MTWRLAQLGLLAPLLTAVSGTVALSLWMRGDWQLLTSGPDHIPMAPVTAVVFIILGLSILARRLRPESDGMRRVETVAIVISIGAAAVELLAPWLGSRAPWSGLLPPPEARAFPFPVGRMSPVTAAGLLLSGLAVLLARRRRASIRWVAVLSAVSTLLIALTVLAGYAVGAPLNYGAGRVPMALLTGATLAILGLSHLLDESTRGLMRSRLGIDRNEPELGGERAFTLRLAGLTLGLALLIVVTAVVYTRNELTQARASVWRELDSVASLKAHDLEQWREERLAEGHFLFATPQIAEDIRAFLTSPDSTAARQRVVNWLDPIRGGDRYESAHVFDAQGRLRLSLPEGTSSAPTATEPSHPVNPHFSRLTGYSREEVLGQNARLLQSGETPAAVYGEMWSRLSSGDTWEGEFHNRKKNGELFWEHATISPVRDARGEIKSYVGVKEDITERRRVAEQVAAQLAELLRWQAAMLGREGRVQELKREVNVLSRRLGHPAPYTSQEAEPTPAPPRDAGALCPDR